MKKFLLLLLFPLILHAAGGDTLRYSTRVLNFADGDTFFTDIHWHPMKDTVQSILNGRIGNANIAADALIKPTKLDSTDTLIIINLRAKNLIETDTINASFIGSVDSAYIKKLVSDTILGADTIKVSNLQTTNLRGTVNFDILTGGDSIYTDNAKLDTINSHTITTLKAVVDTAAPFTIKGISTIDGDGRFVLSVEDSASALVGVGGGIGFAGQYDTTGDLVTTFGAIWGEKENTTQGNKAGQIHIGTRNNAGNITEVLNINSTPNVGIGTTSPSKRLDVNGSINFNDTLFGDTIKPTGNLRVLGSINISDSVFAPYISPFNTDTIRASGASGIYILDDGDTGLFLADGGEVGLGVTPQAWNVLYRAFQLGGLGAYYSSAGTGASGATYLGHNIYSDPVGNKNIANDETALFELKNGAFVWYSAAAQSPGTVTIDEKLRLTVGGNLGVDTATPGSKLHVAGSIRARDTIFSNTLITTNLGSTISKGSFSIGTGGGVQEILVSDSIVFDGNSVLINLETEGSAALDTLSIINGGTSGDILYLRTNNAGRDVLVEDAAGNINIEGNFTFNDNTDTMVLLKAFTSGSILWIEVSRSDN